MRGGGGTTTGQEEERALEAREERCSPGLLLVVPPSSQAMQGKSWSEMHCRPRGLHDLVPKSAHSYPLQVFLWDELEESAAPWPADDAALVGPHGDNAAAEDWVLLREEDPGELLPGEELLAELHSSAQ